MKSAAPPEVTISMKKNCVLICVPKKENMAVLQLQTTPSISMPEAFH
jgi:hypothetical protein